MDNNGLICCVTGHRPMSFPWNYSDKECPSHKKYLETITCTIEKAIRDYGVDYFIVGGAIGVDTDFAEAVLNFRDLVYDSIKLEVAVPCNGQDFRWSAADKERYKKILEQADNVSILSQHYTPFCMQKRNEYMVDHSDIVFAFWNEHEKMGGTVNTIRYAKSKNKRLEIFVLNTF